MTRFVGLLAVCLCLQLPGVAMAHPAIDEADALYERADFAGALEALARAEASTDLTRDDLVRLYKLRALVRHGMRSTGLMEADLRRLASLTPDAEFSTRTPPSVVRAFAKVAGELTEKVGVEVSATRTGGAVRVEATVRGDVGEVVRFVRVHARVGEDGPFETGRGTMMVDAPAAGGVVQFHAEAVGVGGAVVARDGDGESPKVMEVPGSAESGASPVSPEAEAEQDVAAGLRAGAEEKDEGGGPGAWPFVVAGAGVAAAVAVVLALTLPGGGSEGTRLDPPIIEFGP